MIKPVFVFGSIPKEARKIREAVFVREQGFSDEFDQFDARSWHLVLFRDDVPIATGRFYFEDPETAHIGRVAVVPSYRGHQVGTYVVKFLMSKSKSLGVRKAVLLSQFDKRMFYHKIGFREDPDGEVIMEQGCPHIFMRIDYGMPHRREKR